VAGCFNALFARADVYLGWHSRTHSHTLKGLKGLAGYSLSQRWIIGPKKFGQAKRPNGNGAPTSQANRRLPNKLSC